MKKILTGDHMKRILMITVAAGIVVVGFASPALAETSAGQRFHLIFRGPGVTPVGVGAGPISGVGTYDPASDRLDLPAGSILFRSQMTTNTFVPDFGTCTATVNQEGTWQIIGGTGAFADASGEGTATTLVGRIVGVRSPDGCTFGPGAVGVVIIQLTGTATVATAAAA